MDAKKGHGSVQESAREVWQFNSEPDNASDGNQPTEEQMGPLMYGGEPAERVAH